MTAGEWGRIESIFHAASALNGEEREAYLLSACEGAVLAEVSSLIDAAESDEQFLQDPVTDLALAAISGGAGGPPAQLSGTIGGYEILEKIGEGGMGDVYRALDKALGREVALKFISSCMPDDGSARRRLAREAQAAAAMNHRNVCPIYELGEAGGHHFIAMEFVRGVTLDRVIADGAVEEPRLTAIAKQIAEAIACAHSCGIVHRDIKPGNIMLTDDEEIKVLDFGLAKLVRPPGDTRSPDRSQASRGLIFGTVGYMSPEQLPGEKTEFGSDIFSFGTLLYELATGVSPFRRNSQAETIAAILAGEYDAGPIAAHGIPVRVAAIVRKCLEPSTERRYQSFAGVLSELDGAEPGVRSRAERFFRRVLAPAIAALVFFGLGYLFLLPEKRYEIAVLPFANETGDAGLDFLGDGLAETLIARLAQSPRLRVKAFSLVPRGGGPESDPFEIGRALRSEIVVSGRIVRSGDRLAVRTNILDAEDGVSLWNWEDQFEDGDVHGLQKALAERLASGLQVDVEAPQRPGSLTESSESLREYLRGRHLWRRRGKENIQKAITAFQRSIELDPGFARPHAGLADSYVLLSLVSYGSVPAREAMMRAKAAAKQSLEIDPANAEALTSLGIVRARYEWDWAAAEEAYRRAIESDPDYPAAHYWYSELLSVLGRADESVDRAEKAASLDPFSPNMVVNRARTLYFARRYDEALRVLLDSGDHERGERKIRYMVGLVYIQQGRLADAERIFEEISIGDKLFGAAVLGFTYARLGRRKDALRILDELGESSKSGYVPAQEFAIIHIGLGQNDKAIEFLKEAHRDRHPALVSIKAEPLFDPLRGHEGFRKLAAAMSLN